jgi:pyrroline-5-carboxylate reductase
MSSGRVLLLGAGRMGGALLKGWLAAETFAEIRVVDPSPTALLRNLSRDGKIVWDTNFDGPATPALDAAVLATKPQVLKGQAPVLRQIGETGTLILSIAAGVPTAALSQLCGGSNRIVRAMPNTPGAIGKGITALYAPPALAQADKDLAAKLVAALGESLWLSDEGAMDAVTAVSGSGPAYVFLLVEALTQAGIVQGLDAETAKTLARATIMGSGALLAADSRSPETLRQEVTSPGGTTEAALKILMAEPGLTDLLNRAVAAATERGKELGR